MGDGGVACMSSHIDVERFPASENLCGVGDLEQKMRELDKIRDSSALERGPRKVVDERLNDVELEKGEFVSSPATDRRGKEVEVEKSGGEFHENGELENGEFVPDEWRKRELEKGEFVPDICSKGENEKFGKGHKIELEKGEFVPDICSKGENEKFGKGHKIELEKGEFVPDSKWRNHERNPEAHHHRGDLDQRNRTFGRFDNGFHERRGDTTTSKHDSNSNGKIHENDSSSKDFGRSGTFIKRNSMESKLCGSKHYTETIDRSGSKSRRISEDSNYSHSRHQGRYHRNFNTASLKTSSTTRYSSSRHRDPNLRSRGHDKHRRSPDGRMEWSSLHERTRSHEHRNHSPLLSMRSPHDVSRHRDFRERSSGLSEKSPLERTRRHDYHRLPYERARRRDPKERNPGHLEHSHNCNGSPDHREANRGNTENKYWMCDNKTSRRDSSSKNASKDNVVRQSSDSNSCPDKTAEGRPYNEKESNNQSIRSSEPPLLPPPLSTSSLPSPLLINGVQEELPSMEEDMDICTTPPHTFTSKLDMGKWYYLDHFGNECGPSKLMDLKLLVEEGVLLSDHLIKHLDSDRWVTVENAASPLVYHDMHSVVLDNTLTQTASDPQVPGNLLFDAEEFHKRTVPSLNEVNNLGSCLNLDEHQIDERVEALLEGCVVIPGKEIEIIGGALNSTFVHAELDSWERSEGFTRFQVRGSELTKNQRDDESRKTTDIMLKENSESKLSVPSEKECPFVCGDSTDWFAGRWPCKGGDWKRNEDASQDRSLKRKLVLSEGYPLCQMPKCGYEDPRWKMRDDLHHASYCKKLDLPSWAYTWADDKSDSSTEQNKNMHANKPFQAKSLPSRGTKGTMLSVIRINACVVKDHGSSISEPRLQAKSKDRPSSRTMRSHSGVSDKNTVTEGNWYKRGQEYDLHSGHKFKYSINIPSDHVRTQDELALHMGEWYYMDGAGRELGPYVFSELKDLVSKNVILEHSVVFRKADNTWVQISKTTVATESIQNNERTLENVKLTNKETDVFFPFHDLHPQFIGFMCGKLHELVMKSYKSREFAAAINGVLDPWLNANQPKELDMHFSFKSAKSSSVFSHGLSCEKFQRSEEDYPGVCNYSAKRPRLINDGIIEDYDMDSSYCLKNDYSFEDLCTDDVPIDANFSAQSENWGLLNYRILGRIFHFLRDDTKSLLFSAATCKHWKKVVGFYKSISKYVDFSSAGPSLADNMFQNIMKGYDSNKLTTIILATCTNVSSSSLGEVIRSFPGISSINIRGCNQFRELVPMFQHVRWIESQNSFSTRYLEDPYSKARSLKQITEKSYSIAKSLKASSSYFESFNDDSGNFGSNSIVMGRKDSSDETFNKQSYYKRTKLLDARKSSGALSRDAQFKQLIRKRSTDAYKNMEPLIANSLKSIMKENTFEFLVPKVEEIQDRMKNGYYALHGLNYVQNDIRKMCRIIIKANKKSDTGDLKKIKSSFLQLVERLENPMKSNEKNTVNGSHGLFFSEDAKIKRKQSKTLHEKKYLSRNSNTSHDNGGYKNGNYKFGHDIKKSIPNFNKRYMDSETETSDDGDLFEDGMSESESTESDTESDPESHSEAGMGNQDGFLVLDDATNTVEEREWGARMTKASLVPPVTRTYENIERYIAVADEGEVKRKMSVSLPDDYVEKLRAQSDGVEEMEIPEVKNYKPRKKLKEEVIEQEVYGIDPYTHNLLLDSIPKDMQWSLSDMHDFIEDVLLRTLNKQVHHFTGSGNAPMVYSLQHVIEEIKKKAEDGGDTNTMKMCHSLLKNMRSRSVENYVAYRKGLGVVCNKENGFPKDDFVVEFLGEVYPAWKWYEKQDGIRSLQKNSKEPLPEFYNINLERPKGDGQGYDLVVVDAMHKANYASRICHSCKPNCEAKVTAVDGNYQIGVYTLKPIAYGEEITFDYNSVTESKDEYEASVCLCGSQVCRGSFLNLTGEEAYQNVLKECHGMLDRHKLMLKACEANSVSEEDYLVLGRAGLGTCLLADLPDWLIAYSAHLVRFINFERKKLPEEILKLNGEEKMKYIPNYNPEDDKIDAQIQAEGVYNQRLQNMAITIDKVKYVMRNVFGNPKLAPPPLERLSPEAVASALWKGDGSLIDELLKCLALYVEVDALNDLKSKIRLHDPSGSDDVKSNLKKSLLWLRDEIRDLPCSQKCRNDAAADLIHMYAYTKSFFKIKEYESFTSPPVYISPLDMGPKYMEKMSSGFQEYRKTYGKNYCFSQLIYWHNQTNSDPDCSLMKTRRGCLVLPDISSFYSNNQKSLRKHVYGVKTLREMLWRMEKQSQKPWPRDAIWEFKSSPNFFGSPMFDAVLTKSRLDSDMVQWLKNRPAMFQGARDG